MTPCISSISSYAWFDKWGTRLTHSPPLVRQCFVDLCSTWGGWGSDQQGRRPQSKHQTKTMCPIHLQFPPWWWPGREEAVTWVLPSVAQTTFPPMSQRKLVDSPTRPKLSSRHNVTNELVSRASKHSGDLNSWCQDCLGALLNILYPTPLGTERGTLSLLPTWKDLSRLSIFMMIPSDNGSNDNT
jgi:hypothetical protein